MVYKRISTRTRHNFVPYNDKIADITHADTNKHTLDLAAALSENRKIISVIVGSNRAAGTGVIRYYPNEGTSNIEQSNQYANRTVTIIIASGTNRLQYNLTVANDDWDTYCYGYVVEV